MNKPLAIITGASSGIGLGIALKLRDQGHRAVSWDLRKPADECDLPYFECDVANEASVKNAYEATKKAFGPCRILVNNCGLQFMAPFAEYPVEKWNQLIGVLLTGTFLCSRQVFPDMIAQSYGRIVNISSIHGKVASPYKAAYVAAKHGVLGLSKVMALEGAPHGITVNSICPGFVDTPLMRSQVKSQMELNHLSEAEVLSQVFLKNQSIKSLTQTEQIADWVSFLASSAASTMTGEAVSIAGGWGI